MAGGGSRRKMILHVLPETATFDARIKQFVEYEFIPSVYELTEKISARRASTENRRDR